jgi:two-component system, response regulator FlrC
MPRALQPNIAERLLLPRPEGRSALATTVRSLVGYTIEEVERELILSCLVHYCGNRTWTANVLGISIRTLRNKINEYTAQGAAVARPLGPFQQKAPETPLCTEFLCQHSNFDLEQRQ